MTKALRHVLTERQHTSLRSYGAVINRFAQASAFESFEFSLLSDIENPAASILLIALYGWSGLAGIFAFVGIMVNMGHHARDDEDILAVILYCVATGLACLVLLVAPLVAWLVHRFGSRGTRLDVHEHGAVFYKDEEWKDNWSKDTRSPPRIEMFPIGDKGYAYININDHGLGCYKNGADMFAILCHHFHGECALATSTDLFAACKRADCTALVSIHKQLGKEAPWPLSCTIPSIGTATLHTAWWLLLALLAWWLLPRPVLGVRLSIVTATAVAWILWIIPFKPRNEIRIYEDGVTVVDMHGDKERICQASFADKDTGDYRNILRVDLHYKDVLRIHGAGLFGNAHALEQELLDLQWKCQEGGSHTVPMSE